MGKSWLHLELGLYSAGRRAKAGTVLPGLGHPSGVAEPWAARSAGCDRAAMARWSRDSCSEEESEGDSTKEGLRKALILNSQTR